MKFRAGLKQYSIKKKFELANKKEDNQLEIMKGAQTIEKMSLAIKLMEVKTQLISTAASTQLTTAQQIELVNKSLLGVEGNIALNDDNDMFGNTP